MTNLRNIIIICSMLCSMLIVSCASAPMDAGSGKANLAQAGEPGIANPAQEGRELHYSCWVDGNELIVTTEKDVAESSDYKKSRVYLNKKEYAPVDITDYDFEKARDKMESIEFLEDVLVEKLAQETANWAVGTERTLQVDAERKDHLPVNQREIQIMHTKILPKKTVYDKSVFTPMTRSKAAVGEPVSLDFGVQGEVVAVTENEVEVAFAPQSEKPLEGPYGSVMVRDEGDSLITEIAVQKGDLMRVGGFVGQVSEVGKKTFRIDYSHPFGGRTLACDVAVKALGEVPAAAVAAIQKDNAHNPPPQKTAPSETPAHASAEKNTQSKVVEAGDLVKVAYTATLESGELLRTTDPDVASNPGQKKIKGFFQVVSGPETIIAGSQEEFPGLGRAVLGLKAGDQHEVVILPNEAFGVHDMKQLVQYDRKRIIPALVTMPAQAYTERFGGFPIKDKTVSYNAYVNAKIVDVTEKGAVLKLIPVKEEIDDVFGLTRMQVVDDSIHMYLTPKLGANFELDKRKGRVVSVDTQKFTVDFNDPLAGKKVVYNLKVLELTKASEFSGLDIQWIEDYETGLNMAKELNRPAVLLLLAEWCGYCKKLKETTLVDPRVESMHDDFVWIRLDSDKQYPELKTLYEQRSFPLTVLLNSDGEVVERISGYLPANAFRSKIMKAFASSDKVVGQISK